MLPDLKSLLQRIHPPSLDIQNDYSLLWLVRSHFYGDLRARGIKEVKVNASDPVRLIIGAFPDAKNKLDKMIKASNAKTVKDLTTAMGCQFL